MFDTNAVKQSFSRAAPRYDAQAHVQAQVRERCIGLAKSRWPVGRHILDAGCGTGALSQETSSWPVTGLDVSFGMCSVARLKHAIAVNADAAAMPFADGCFDGVFSSLMLQWANAPLAVLREMARVTQHSCIISTLTHGTLHELQTAFATIDGAPHVSAFLETPVLLDYAAQAGFTVTFCKQETLTEHYPDAIALMRSLKTIGATNKLAKRRRGLMTHGQLARLQAAYADRFGTAQGLPATWQVLYMVLDKPS